MGHVMWPSNNEALSFYQRLATGFTADFGAFATLWPPMAAHLDDDGRELVLRKLALIHAAMNRIADAKAKAKT